VRSPRLKILLAVAAVPAAAYLLIAYVALPSFWRHHEHQRDLDGLPMVTLTTQGIPGDPLNVGLVGSRSDILHAMHAAGWSPADAVTLRSSLEIIGSVLFRRPYPTAPVSPLLYRGRREDLAFEKPEGRSADRRHHVRLWRVLDSGAEGRPVWLGSATFDRGVGLSRYTGEVTHHIAADIDAEREALMADLTGAGMVAATYQVTGVGPTLRARNGGGDLYFTDGEIHFAVLVRDGQPRTEPPQREEPPRLISLKDAVWDKAADLLAR
jgi:LssY C-terminus